MLVFIGGPEIILIVLVIVLFFGSKKIPEFAKAFARAMNEIKDASNEIRKAIKKLEVLQNLSILRLIWELPINSQK